MTDTMKMFKSSAKPITVKAYFEMVVKNILTAGIFGKFDKAANVVAKDVIKVLPSKVKTDLMKSLGDKATDKDLIEILGKVLGEVSKSGGGGVYDKVFASLTGSESEKKIEEQLVAELFDKKAIARAKELAEAKKK